MSSFMKKPHVRSHILSFHWYKISRISKSIQTDGRLVVARKRGNVMQLLINFFLEIERLEDWGLKLQFYLSAMSPSHELLFEVMEMSRN
jgi:hypothetical protein